MSDYDTDILIWSERQAELLRRRAAGELINEADLDWSNIAEEVESVGRSQLSRAKSKIRVKSGHRAAVRTERARLVTSPTTLRLARPAILV
jgi:hypothetical protein